MADALEGRVIHEATDDGVIAGVPLIACPYCGKAESFEGLVNCAQEIDEDGAVIDLSVVACLECGATRPLAEGGLAGALAAWNGRALLSRTPARMH